jgi:hypothetical protein
MFDFNFMLSRISDWFSDSETFGPQLPTEPKIWGNEPGLDIGIIDTAKIVVFGYLALAVYSEFKSPTRKSYSKSVYDSGSSFGGSYGNTSLYYGGNKRPYTKRGKK